MDAALAGAESFGSPGVDGALKTVIILRDGE
jgi:hypothetical protein